jgi:integrase
MPDPTGPDEWHEVNGKWTLSLGERGMRVRLFQKRKGGVFFRATWIAGAGRDQLSLATLDRDEAERLGRELLAEMTSSNAAATPGAIRLGEVWRRYQTGCTTHLDNKPRTIDYESSLIERIIRFFGRTYDVRRFNAVEWRRYALARRAGRIPNSNGKPGRMVGDRAVHGDFVILRTVLRWACQVMLPCGSYWLDRDPTQGIKVDAEQNPVRPIASWSRFEKTRTALQQLADETDELPVKHRWIKIEFALLIAETTGRRLGSIRALDWEDIDLEQACMYWKADADKRNKEWITPLPTRLSEEVPTFKQRLGGASGPVHRFLARVDHARASLRAGHGVRLEDLPPD